MKDMQNCRKIISETPDKCIGLSGVPPQIPCFVRDGVYTDLAQAGTDFLVFSVAIKRCKANGRQE